jgi:Protein of unknown function (DUF2516)
MFPLVGSLQAGVLLLLSLAAFAMEVFALVDAVRHSDSDFVAAGKRTKTFWVAVTGVAAAIGFVRIGNPLGIFSLLAVVAAGVYLADVRPALAQVRGRGGGRGNAGPYGPW